jgi:hypothetical protein
LTKVLDKSFGFIISVMIAEEDINSKSDPCICHVLHPELGLERIPRSKSLHPLEHKNPASISVFYAERND